MALNTNIFAVSPPTSVQSGGVGTIVDANEWLEVTVSKESSGVVLVGTRDDLSIGANTGMAIPVDRPIRMILAPDTKLYAIGENTAQRLTVVITPAQWITSMMLLFGKLDRVLKLVNERLGGPPIEDVPLGATAAGINITELYQNAIRRGR